MLNTNLNKEIEELCFKYRKQAVLSIKQLQESGSPRKYFRINFPDSHSIIAAYSENIKENETFIYFSGVFASLLVNTPKVLAVNAKSTIYLMEDVGSTSLLDVFSKSETEKLSIAQQALDYLIVFQTDGVKHIDFSKCYQKQIFDKELIFWDLNYFKYYFLKHEIDSLNEPALEADFRILSDYLTAIPNNYFMYRDFQSRNIQVNNGKLYFIDYQGGMQGPLQYDLASLIYQAKANFSESERKSLVDYYLQSLSAKNSGK
ncbi:MAG: phosphotransferase [Bacteroidales bacterium]|nr:phosphotransferase [Bacteroidales bacterium]